VKDTSWLVEVVFLCGWSNPLHAGGFILSRSRISCGWAKFLAKRVEFSLDSRFSIGGPISLLLGRPILLREPPFSIGDRIILLEAE